MSLPRSVLYPVDFSQRCYAVWPAVVDMARQLNATITVLHALDLRRVDSALLPGELSNIRQRVQAELNAFPGESEPRALRRELTQGAAADSIVQYAATMEAPLIMMPTRGHTRFRQLLLGSVTAAVLHDATCPVWTEAHVEGPPAHEVSGHHSLVCAVDMGTRTASLLEAAMDFSRQFGATLHVVHSIPHGDGRFSTGLSSRAHAYLVSNAQDSYVDYSQKAGVNVPLEIVDEYRLVDGILGAIAKHNADLLVIGRGVIQGTLGRLRTNAHDLIRSAPCEVLSI
jgi:nucleotide-binding universal stress UspA family protein